MKLAVLEPKWIHPNLFIFLCPHCKKVWLSCKDVVMAISVQYEQYTSTMGLDSLVLVPCNQIMIWQISVPDFNRMTVTPSIDASNSGHWHGFITDGEVSG